MLQRENYYSIFTRIWAVAALVLISLTYLLWLPQTELPQIPFFEFLVDIPASIDYVLLPVAVTALLVSIFSSSKIQTKAAGIFSIAMIGLISFDQNRLQPWAYQFVVFGILFAFTTRQRSVFWMKWIVISVYVYSAISKFDYQFIHTVGRTMLEQLAGFMGSRDWPPADGSKDWIALVFPAFELATGILLCFRRTQRIGVYCAICIHVGLIAILGPWALAHEYPVLVWNVFFIVQAVMLFGETSADDQLDSINQVPISGFAWGDQVASILAIFVLAFPLTCPLGICDHWPAWEVYAPRTSRLSIQSGSKLSAEYFGSLNEQSLDRLGAPIYPQARVQLAVAIGVNQIQNSPSRGRGGISVNLSSVSDRFTGARETVRLTGDQLVMHAQRYWLNTRPRQNWTYAYKAEQQRQ